MLKLQIENFTRYLQPELAFFITISIDSDTFCLLGADDEHRSMYEVNMGLDQFESVFEHFNNPKKFFALQANDTEYLFIPLQNILFYDEMLENDKVVKNIYMLLNGDRLEIDFTDTDYAVNFIRFEPEDKGCCCA